MKRRRKNIMIGGSVVCQVIVMMVYSFGNYAVSKYCYLTVWLLCAALVRYMSGVKEVS